MGLFDKKFCDVCGEKIKFLGNRKLEDGNLCKDCANKLSPFFSERRKSTVADIKEQLAYREENKEKVAAFQPTKTIGTNPMILFDEDKQQWLFTRSRSWRNENPDIIDFSQVTGVNLDIDEDRTELKREDKDGNEVSYNPPRYEYSYDFNMTIHINSPWFDQINFRLNNNEIERRGSVEYQNAEKNANEIIETLTSIRENAREQNKPKTAVVCPNCKATTMPDQNGCCEYCRSAL